ncbi:PCNA-interacting partner [Hyperolius riggenbachi]|uniref:PCNA-interacting partner n=1 Tax=Hyperolius riggenbachi TaxID=752182 RepID=UPI0035A3D5B3
MASQQQAVLDLIRRFRCQWSLVCESERTTVCSADNMLLMLQLAVAEVNKKNGKEFTAPLSDLLFIWKHFMKDKLGLNSGGTQAPGNYEEVQKTYELFQKNSNTLDLIDLHGKINCPTEANALSSVATSFIRMLELGGKGYAPCESDPLRKHLKGLSLFVHFIDKLDEILGETHDTRTATEKLLSAIKMRLMKGRSSGDPFSEAVLETAEDLDLRIKNLINLSSEKHDDSTGISPSRPRIHAINRGTALCGREMIKILIMLLDEEAANQPTKNKAELLCADEDDTIIGSISILSLFRTPDQYGGSSPKSLGQRVQKCISKDKPKLKQNLIKSQFSCTYKDGSSTQHKPCDFPSMSQATTCIHPAPKIPPVLSFDEEPMNDVSKQKPSLIIQSGNSNIKEKSKKEPMRKTSKRKQADTSEEQENIDEPPQKKTTKEKATSSKSSSKGTAKNKLIVGQAKLTSFFRL